MKKRNLLLFLHVIVSIAYAQTNPAIYSWLRNTTVTGSYYTSGNSTAQSNGILVNCQQVEYSANSVYVKTKGMPAYKVGPYLDGNPNQAGDQNAIFKFPLNPTKNTGTPTSTTMGNIGVFINGVALFNYSDGVSWNNAQSKFCGGPIQCQGDGIWNRDAIVYEKSGFDCSKGHPAGTNYHHHQNPSAFKWDKTVISTICNLYDADALYAIDETKHSPLIGFAYDGFPIYGAYGYANTDGTGGIARMKSSYQLRSITTRTTYANGSTVTAGPAVSTTYPLGSFQEDYEYVAHPSDPTYLDEHNGRFCKTPEYPNGIYCYFATVDANHNSTYPYAVGPTFYGVYANRKVTSISEATTIYNGSSAPIKDESFASNLALTIHQNSELLVVQYKGIVKRDIDIVMYAMDGKQVSANKLYSGQTLSYIDLQALYEGTYIVRISDGTNTEVKKITVQR